MKQVQIYVREDEGGRKILKGGKETYWKEKEGEILEVEGKEREREGGGGKERKKKIAANLQGSLNNIYFDEGRRDQKIAK